MEFPDNWFANERGNTWLMDDDGNHVMYVNVTPKVRMEIMIFPADSPGLHVSLLSEEDSTDERLSKYILDNFGGWYAKRLNIEGIEAESGFVPAVEDELKFS
jgi:hypothetical protein